MCCFLIMANKKNKKEKVWHSVVVTKNRTKLNYLDEEQCLYSASN